ncbi:polygalacturonase [Haloferula luteola]|uniref:Polygalacturonase n=1 Tax=Haloferula luteola TaxID=595692 RepID=A0A840VEJ8_9BACT|nr:glycoside hydrolase family 28 protein [Haloferula luteola]MBB5351251.1 polygalacturonase [Haloferula luteola]
MRRPTIFLCLLSSLFATDFNIRDQGAQGNGITLDTAFIQQAIDAAAEAGGGTVRFPAGTYLSFSLQLRSDVHLQFDPGATLLAADPADGQGRYDAPEPNPWDAYQDFGHSHWQNSLIWGIDLENVSITGPGKIDGKGLSRRSPGPRRPTEHGDFPLSLGDDSGAEIAVNPGGEEGNGDMDGLGTKAIALKNCRHVTLRDLTIFRAGHFALLATGIDDLTLDNLKVDTNRDGFDIDSCRQVRISNCLVNTPNDDAIVLKSSYALGENRVTENVTITNCQVSGFDLGTMLDGTFGRTQTEAPDREGVCGRIKFGTESNGGFRNIAISNITMERCRGIALETVDGGFLEDVTITNVTMREIVNAPLFLRLGARLRAPEGTRPGTLKRIRISHVNVEGADPDYASIIAGTAHDPIEDISLSHIHIRTRGGGTLEQAARELPDVDAAYPEPSMFGITNCHGFLVRHVRGITFHDVSVTPDQPDFRPPFHLHDVLGARFFGVRSYPAEDLPALSTRGDVELRQWECEPSLETSP